MGRPKRVDYDQARDRLFMEICRCNVLEASDADAAAWLDDTVQYLAQEYPALTREELGELRMAGGNYVAPPIPHGKGINATNREEWADEAAATEA
ncbi:MAG: hypothetical protein M8866_02680 [marine benthic group bacterium]|nr:hypothetical protein [Gemmatimonadota bacterium]MCL7970983.1 hypothetical protein [Candidatus Benthicola marisminoris]